VEGRRFQKDTPAYCVPMDSEELKRALGDGLVKIPHAVQ
jgi:hypothetical protein